MKKQILFISFLLNVVVLIHAQHIKINSNFEHGNIVLKERVGDSLLVLETRHSLKSDSIGEQYYWFYFQLDKLPQKTLSLRFENLKGVYRGNPHLIYRSKPCFVFSYDQEEWFRMKEGEYDTTVHSYTVKQKFDNGPVWIAWDYPYTYSHSLSYMGKIGSNPHVNIERISKTPGGRGIFLYNISKEKPPVNTKPTIFTMALQHPGEDAGGYFIEGFVDHLLNSKTGTELLSRYNFAVIHVMNPDGLTAGTTRYNTHMEDLNNVWIDPENPQPEVEGVKNWIESYLGTGNRIHRALDVHCWGQETKHLYLSNNDQDFNELLNKQMFFKWWKSTNAQSATAYFSNIPGTKSATVEISQKFNNSDVLLTQKDYREAGSAILEALLKEQ